MADALYRIYRSKSLDEVVGQEHITTTLAHALQAGRLSHAYLFTGPRGVGKTSIARILAHAINQLPYDGSNHIDIIEIDAASNRRIDEIRDLRDKVYIAPTRAAYKVYIIDEVHMLTKEAFNALLKTLEEPPAHVIFILATTEASKLPATIISRTQRYVFRPVTSDKVVAHLRTIADAEAITITDDALELIARHGEGSFRDSISLLDQAGNYGGPVTRAMLQDMLGVASDDALTALLGLIAGGQTLATVASLQELLNQGFSAGQLAAQLATVLRDDILSTTPQVAHVESLALQRALIEVPASADPARKLELALMAATMAITPPAAAQPRAAAPVPPATPPKPAPVAPKPQATATSQPVSMRQVKPPTAKDEIAMGDDAFELALWPDVLDAVRRQYNTLYSILKTAEPTVDEGVLKLCVQFPFHQKRLQEVKNRQIICDVIKAVTGLDAAFECSVKPKTVKVDPPVIVDEAPPPDPVKAVSSIFGGGEVLG